MQKWKSQFFLTYSWYPQGRSLKTKFRKEGNELVSATNQLKLLAMVVSHLDSTKIRALLKKALTDRIADREIFMKGIDYSYYYEQEE
jgi:hypothetical protein